MTSAANASSSIADWACAAVRLNVCLSRPQAPHEHRRPQHEQDVADDRSDDRRLDDLLEPLQEREERDHQLGEVPERHVQEAADAGSRAGGQLLGGLSHHRRRGHDPERRREEDQRSGAACASSSTIAAGISGTSRYGQPSALKQPAPEGAPSGGRSRSTWAGESAASRRRGPDQAGDRGRPATDRRAQRRCAPGLPVGRPEAVRPRPRAELPRRARVVDRLAGRGPRRPRWSCGRGGARTTRSCTRPSTWSSARCRSTTCSSSCCCSRTSPCRSNSARGSCSGGSCSRSPCADWRSSAESR